MTRLQGVFRKRDGSAVPNGTNVEIRRKAAGTTLVANVSCDATGRWVWTQNGSPGPYTATCSYAGDVAVVDSATIGNAGSLNLSALDLFLRLFSNGYVAGLYGGLTVTAPGSGMTVNVAAGGFVAQGILYDQYTVVALPIVAADTQPRIDLVCVEVCPSGATGNVEGRSQLVVLKGTPSATPVPPSPTQTSDLWQEPLALVTVGANVSVIAADKVTMVAKPAAPIIPAGSITIAQLSDLAKAIHQVYDGDTLIASDVSRFKFDAAQFAITKDAAVGYNQVNIALTGSGGGGAAGKIAWKDANFDFNANVNSDVLIATAKLTLQPGKYVLISDSRFSGYANPNSSQMKVYLNGNATPTAPDNSERIFVSNGNVTRLETLTGMLEVTVATAGDYTVNLRGVKIAGYDPTFVTNGFLRLLALPQG